MATTRKQADLRLGAGIAALALAAVLAAACAPASTAIPCNRDLDCPTDLRCVHGLCTWPGHEAETGAADAGEADAGEAEAGTPDAALRLGAASAATPDGQSGDAAWPYVRTDAATGTAGDAAVDDTGSWEAGDDDTGSRGAGDAACGDAAGDDAAGDDAAGDDAAGDDAAGGSAGRDVGAYRDLGLRDSISFHTSPVPTDAAAPPDQSSGSDAEPARDSALPAGVGAPCGAGCPSGLLCVGDSGAYYCRLPCTLGGGECDPYTEHCIELVGTWERACVPGLGLNQECYGAACADLYACVSFNSGAYTCRLRCDPGAAAPGCPGGTTCYQVGGLDTGACL